MGMGVVFPMKNEVHLVNDQTLGALHDNASKSGCKSSQQLGMKHANLAMNRQQKGGINHENHGGPSKKDVPYLHGKSAEMMTRSNHNQYHQGCATVLIHRYP